MVRTRRLSRGVACAVSLALIVLALAVLSTAAAHVPFELRVDGARASLLIDDQRLTTAWPAGIRKMTVQVPGQDLRLFQIDGSDTANNGTYNSGAFAPVASSGYYQAVCWMRECSSYSQWVDFSLTDDWTGLVMLRHASAAALAQVTVPTRFTLRGSFQRPETYGVLHFVGGSGVDLTIDANGRKVQLGDTTRYFPHRWVPMVAEFGWTLTRSYLWAIPLLAIAAVLSALVCCLLLPYRVFTRWLSRLRISWPHAMVPQYGYLFWAAAPWGAAVALFGVLLAIATYTFDRLPRVFDGVTYYMEAQIIRSGQLALPYLGSYTDVHFIGPFAAHVADHWFMSYPPGAPIAIAVGLLVGWPWAVEPALGALSALLIYRFALRWYGRPTAFLCLALVGISPFFLILSSTYFSHSVALFADLVCLEGIDRLVTTGKWRWGAVAGSGFGYAFITRELGAALFAVALLTYYGALLGPTVIRRFRKRGFRLLVDLWPPILALLLPIAILVGFYLFYNLRLTGDPLTPARVVVTPDDRYGFGLDKGWWHMHTLAAGFFVGEEQLTSLLIHLFGWPYYFTLSFFSMPLLTFRLRRRDLLFYLLAASFLFGYMGYFYSGVVFGPRYLYESFPAYVILTARGIVEVAALSAAVLARLLHPPQARAAGWAGVVLVFAALCANDLAFYLPRQFLLYHDYQAPLQLASGIGYDRLHPAWMRHALVVTNDWGVFTPLLAPLNSGAHDGDIVYAHFYAGPDLQDLRAHYPHRAVYFISVSDAGLQFVPMTGGPRASLVTLSPTSDPSPSFAALAVGPSGDFFAADNPTGLILHFSAAGKQLGAISTGVPPGQDFAVQWHDRKLFWFDPSTGILWQTGTNGEDRLQVFTCRCASPRAFAFDKDGTVLVVAAGEEAVKRYTPSGILIGVGRGLKSTGAQQSAIVAGADGQIFAFAAASSDVLIYDHQLTLRSTRHLGSSYYQFYTRLAAAGPWVLLTDPVQLQLVAFNMESGELRRIALSANSDPLGSRVWGMASDGHNVWIGSDAMNQPTVVQLLDPFPSR